MDRRVKYTKMVLTESLIRHLEQKPLEKITVTELCKDADVNRSTYYAHYTDPFDQFSKLKADLLEDLTSFTEHVEEGQETQVLENLLTYVDSKKPVFKTILSQNGSYDMQQYILSVIGEKLFAGKLKNRHMLFYASSGCFGLFYDWLVSADPITPKKLAFLMVAFTKRLIEAGAII